ncbi:MULTISPECIES: hypothetical protein [Adlercreutzia]|uniref:hypothetical protein n=1 Tax=Adlercreutzia TaxID=447020 RepID=UPI001EDD08FA|nr:MULTISPECIES: hypothetical protein [Adlercreutzia]MBS5740689.1 hypothetical protein [Adlercreutzia equolifaciens]MCG4824556.1 hypothetical protein [Adlercreutzia equolifaciens]MCQ5069449.1 hypothetical protein [Adlercreutzia sp. DFI.6.23]
MEEQSPAAGAPTGSGGRPPAEGRFRSAATTAATAQKPSSRRAAPSGEGDAGREVRKGREGRSSAPSRKRRHPVRVAVVSVVIVVVLLVGAAAGGFAWLRWFSEDDAADFTGTWYLAGTTAPIAITEDRIQLTDDVSYRYALNDQDKTFELSFGNLKGGGRYRFSLDRNQLALVDGDFSAADTLGDDITWTLRALTESAQGRVLAPGEAARGVTLLSRTPTGTPSLPEATDTPEATAGEDAKADTGDGSKSGNDDGGAEPDKADATPAPDTSDKADDRA